MGKPATLNTQCSIIDTASAIVSKQVIISGLARHDTTSQLRCSDWDDLPTPGNMRRLRAKIFASLVMAQEEKWSRSNRCSPGSMRPSRQKLAALKWVELDRIFVASPTPK